MGTIWTQIEKRTTVGILNQLTTFTRSMITHLPACKLPVPFQGCVTRKLSPSPSMSRGQPCRASRTGPGFVPASCSYVQIVHKLPVVAGYCSVATRPVTLPSIAAPTAVVASRLNRALRPPRRPQPGAPERNRRKHQVGESAIRDSATPQVHPQGPMRSGISIQSGSAPPCHIHLLKYLKPSCALRPSRIPRPWPRHLHSWRSKLRTNDHSSYFQQPIWEALRVHYFRTAGNGASDSGGT